MIMYYRSMLMIVILTGDNELGTFIHDKNNDLESIASKVIMKI